MRAFCQNRILPKTFNKPIYLGLAHCLFPPEEQHSSAETHFHPQEQSLLPAYGPTRCIRRNPEKDCGIRPQCPPRWPGMGPMLAPTEIRRNQSKVFIGDLPRDASESEIQSAFNKYGTVRNVWVARNPPGFAFVEFDDPRDADDAIRKLDGS
ncbi:uncharacterized protein LOC115229529 [Octopus sinensis]|uniref:Uncharacterized protein LOC115229529 n=1 Tax=Octopus sinensis TaxID=2607531 RepID=A0A6P7U2I9_9MOLL|nr:uncharacterized protein LOC115229529 [Octopus sinensis]